MMLLPAALKWLVIGASAWAAWRLPNVAGELARLGGDKAPSVQIATRPTAAVATPVTASSLAHGPRQRRIERRGNTILLALPAPLPPIRMAPAGSSEVRTTAPDRKSAVSGKRVSDRVNNGVRRNSKKKHQTK